jgi:hypothetical protein
VIQLSSSKYNNLGFSGTGLKLITMRFIQRPSLSGVQFLFPVARGLRKGCEDRRSHRSKLLGSRRAFSMG